MLLNTEQIDRLIAAARTNWREVEPAIFGTLLERALDPTERHALGAHYTPRAYVERLVLPTVVKLLDAIEARFKGHGPWKKEPAPHSGNPGSPGPGAARG